MVLYFQLSDVVLLSSFVGSSADVGILLAELDLLVASAIDLVGAVHCGGIDCGAPSNRSHNRSYSSLKNDSIEIVFTVPDS